LSTCLQLPNYKQHPAGTSALQFYWAPNLIPGFWGGGGVKVLLSVSGQMHFGVTAVEHSPRNVHGAKNL
jgi:hypothetical protein